MQEIEFKAIYLDERFLATPAIALGQAQHEIVRMGQYAYESLQDATGFFFNKENRTAELALQKEELVNELNRKITDYIVKIHQKGLSPSESESATGWFQAVSDLERIGDHAENIVELGEFRITNKLELSAEAATELKEMMEVANQAVNKALVALEHKDKDAAKEVLQLELKLDELEIVYRKNHIQRLHKDLCSVGTGSIYLDLLTNLERIGDHSKNIAQFVLHE